MQVSVEESGALERRLTVTIAGENIEAEVARRLEGLGKNAKIKGFRPGKAPPSVVRQRYGDTVREDVIDELQRSHYVDAVTEQRLSPAGQPRFSAGETAEDGSYTFVAEVEVYPEFEPQGTDSLDLVRPRIEISDTDVDEVLERLRRQRGVWREVDRPARSGDQVIVDFEGRVEGQAFEGNRATEMPLVLGSGELIPGFEEGLVGVAAGETRTLDLKFPEAYRKSELAGRAASFEVVARRVEERELPPLDEAFAAQFGIAEGGVAALREKVRENMAGELEEKIRADLRRQANEQLLESNESVSVPTALVDEEIRRRQSATLRQLGISPEGGRVPQLPRDPFVAEAERRVRLGLILSRLVESEGFRPDPQRVSGRIEELAAAAADPGAEARRLRADNHLMRHVEAQVLEDMAYDWLFRQAATGERASTFFEYMEPAPSGADKE